MPTRSVMERLLVRKSRESALQADSIFLIESFLIHLRAKKQNKSNENEY